MRLVNGSITKMKGKRRNPYRVRKTIGYTLEDGKAKQNMKTIGYFPTREKALDALIEFNKNPYSVDCDITFQELYDRWSTEHFQKVPKMKNQYTSAYKSCINLYDKKFNDIRLSDLQHTIDTCGKNYPSLKTLKSVLVQIYDYARKHEICMINRAKDIDVLQYKDKNPNKIDRKVFTDEDIEKLWKQKDNKYVSIILIMIYSGLRLQEMRDLKKEDVHMDDHYLDIRHSKTAAGIRKVPISDKTYPLIEKWLKSTDNKTYLFCGKTGNHFSDPSYRNDYWCQTLEAVNVDTSHLPHDTRHTCVSLLTKAGIDERLIRRIVGHSTKDVTDGVYTHLEIDVLLQAINQI